MLSNIKKLSNFLTLRYKIRLQLTAALPHGPEEAVGWQNGVIHMVDWFRVPHGNEFMVAHVFGHLVQFSKRGDAAYDEVSKMSREELFSYEMEASAYGLSLIKGAIGEPEGYCGQYIRFCHADFEYYFNYLQTGDFDLRVFHGFLENGQVSDLSMPSLPLPREIVFASTPEIQVI